MVRKVFIVSRGNTEMYEQLRRALIGEPDVEVIYDRRDRTSKQPDRRASIWARGPLADVGDRRVSSHVDIDLRSRGWAVARVDDGLDDLATPPVEDPPDMGAPRRSPWLLPPQRD